jgi:hypothetical protein
MSFLFHSTPTSFAIFAQNSDRRKRTRRKKVRFQEKRYQNDRLSFVAVELCCVARATMHAIRTLRGVNSRSRRNNIEQGIKQILPIYFADFGYFMQKMRLINTWRVTLCVEFKSQDRVTIIEFSLNRHLP